MKPSLDSYIDVAERILLFKEKYPDGSLQTVSWNVQTIGDRTFVVYRAAAYRDPFDERPGHGTAWEPFPGPTAFTKDSELMNAETSAWGRAIVAVGIVANKVASRQEVQNRSAVVLNGDKPRKLTPAERARMIKAVEDAGENLQLVLAAVNAGEHGELTVVDAQNVKAFLDKIGVEGEAAMTL